MKFSVKAFLVLSLILISQNSFADPEGIPATEVETSSGGGLSCFGGPGESSYSATVPSELEGAASTLTGCAEPASITAYVTKVRTLAEAENKCASSYARARTMCIESCSPSLSTILPMVNTLIGSLRMGGVVDACSKMNKAMNIVQTGLTAYSAACGTTKVMCDSACGKASQILVEIRTAAKAIKPLPTPASGVTCAANFTGDFFKKVEGILSQETETGDEKAVATKKKTCSGYAASLASAGVGIVQAITSAKQAHACDQKVQAADIDTGKLDCSKAENAAMPQCICEKNPRATGCSGEVTGNVSSFTGGAKGNNGATPSSSMSLTGSGGKTGPDGLQKGDTGGGGGVGAPVGGTAGNLDGGHGVGDAKKDQAVVKKLNTNLYGGEGGGGGGGAFGRGGNGTPEKSLAKDPNFLKQREIASTRAQVTAPQGKSNWEKVSERYTTQKSSLIGQ